MIKFRYLINKHRSWTENCIIIQTKCSNIPEFNSFFIVTNLRLVLLKMRIFETLDNTEPHNLS